MDDKTKKLRMMSKVAAIGTGIYILLVGLYDILPALNVAKDDTYSEVTREYGYTFWALPIMTSTLVFHFWWNWSSQPADFKQRFMILVVAMTAILIANGVSWFGFQWHAPHWFVKAGLIFGIFFGSVLWPLGVPK